jgi:lysozyme
MAIGWNKKSYLGSPLDQPVLLQLEKRKKRFTKKVRDNEDIQYLNANSIWIRLMSSVDTLSGVNQDSNEYSSELAKSNILLNGTLTSKGKLRYGAPTNMVFDEQRGDEAYDVTLPDGTVPMPGITAFQVESKNTHGTVRLAKIEFSVHSGDQLSVLEALFMRPGYDVLLEWGHTVYINSKDEVVTSPKKISDTYFMTSGGSHKAIQKGLQDVRILNDYNSDGMFGAVSNFSWKVNGGSFDCSIDIMSKGDLLESVQMNMSNGNVGIYGKAPGEAATTNATQEEKLLQSSAMHQWLGILQYTKATEFRKAPKAIVSRLLSKMFGFTTWMMDFEYNTNTTGIPGEYGYDESLDVRHRVIHHICSTSRVNSNGELFRFMPLAEVLTLLNVVFMPKELIGRRNKVNIVKFWTGDKANLEDPKTPFLTFPEHFALDVGVALLPKTSKKDYVPTLATHFNKKNGQIDDILNIYVNVNYVIETLDKQILETSENTSTILTFVRALMSGIQHTLGDVNEFDISFEEGTGTYFVVDRKIVPGGDQLKNLDSKIDIVGLGSTAENIQITSKNTSSIATMVAIAAQATQSDAGERMLAMQKWNLGLKNRHVKPLVIGATEAKKLEEKPEVTKAVQARLKKFLTDQDSLAALRTAAQGDDSSAPAGDSPIVLDYVASEIKYLIPAHNHAMQKFAGIETRTKKFNPPGLVPIELSFALKGISSIKIGQAFILANEQILPFRYRGNVGFMITGVSHSAEGNRWMTQIKTQMIVVSSFTEEIVKQDTEEAESKTEEVEEAPPYVPPTNPSTRQAPSSLSISDDGLENIKEDEGFRANAYRDPGSGDQPITIGYGTTRINGKAVQLGDTITEPKATSLIRRQVQNIYGAAVKRKVKVDLTQNEYDALVSFTYNVGVGNFGASTLLRKLNEKDYLEAADQFLRWNKAAGQVMRGLTKRRKKERELFLKDSPGNIA